LLDFFAVISRFFFVSYRPLNVKLDISKREMYEIEEDQEGDEAEEDLTEQNVIGVGAGGIFSNQ
jgi:hypothetical protein